MTAPGFDLRRYCAALPDPEPSPELYGGIVRARSRARARRNNLVASVALLVGVSTLLSLSRPPTARNGDVVAREAQPLELELRAIDRELQAAYDRGAGDGELARLWAQRSSLANRDAGSRPMSL